MLLVRSLTICRNSGEMCFFLDYFSVAQTKVWPHSHNLVLQRHVIVQPNANCWAPLSLGMEKTRLPMAKKVLVSQDHRVKSCAQCQCLVRPTWRFSTTQLPALAIPSVILSDHLGPMSSGPGCERLVTHGFLRSTLPRAGGAPRRKYRAQAWREQKTRPGRGSSRLLCFVYKRGIGIQPSPYTWFRVQ